MRNQIYIFGAGKNGNELLSLLKKYGKTEVVAFIDNDPNKQGG